MKKRIALALILIVMAASVAGVAYAWNYSIFDTTWNFTRAIISLPDGTIVDGKVQGWKDFEDGDQIQVEVADVTYLVHSSNVALMAE